MQSGTYVLWLFLIPIVFWGVDWPHIVVKELDHCDVAMCDFVRHYIPQAHHVQKGDSTVVGGWFYPPLLASLLVPFTWLRHPEAGWFMANILALVSMCWLCVRHARVSWWIACICCLQSLPILHALKWGQISLILYTLVLWGVFSSHKTRVLLFTLAGAIKLYPLALIVLDLMNKEYKRLLWAFISFFCMAVFLPFLWMGWEQSLLLWDSVFIGMRKVRGFASNGGGQALYPVLIRYFSDGSHTQLQPIDHGLIGTLPLWLLEILYGVVLSVVIVHTKRAFACRDEVWRYLMLLVVLHIFLSPGWHHYMSFLPFVLLWCFQKQGERFFSSIGLLCILFPVLFLGHVHTLYPHYSAWGGTFWSVIFAWGSLIRISKMHIARPQ